MIEACYEHPLPCIFFDLDGVLIDSAPTIERCLNVTLASHGLRTLSSAEATGYIGPPIVEAFRAMLRESNRDLKDAPAYVAGFRMVYADRAPRETPLMPGIAELLSHLDGSFELAVATSKAQHLAESILAALGVHKYFRQIIGPAPEALDESKTATLGRAISAVGAPSERIMVGDRHFDISAGKAHHCRTIGVTWGSGSREELLAAGADAIVDDPSELLREIRT